MFDDLDGKVTLVTGGAAGIGATVTELLVTKGGRVGVLDIDGRPADELAERLSRDRVLACHGSVAVEEDVAAAVERTATTFGRLDVLVCCAAAMNLMPRDRDVLSMSVEVWDGVLAVNLRGVMLACKHALPHMLAAGSGSIVAMSSAVGVSADLGRPAYAASKAAIAQLTRSIAADYGKAGIRANSIAPGLIRTPRTAGGLPAEYFAMHERHALTPYLGEPDDIANAVAYLASDASKFVTGQLLSIDGGLTVANPVVADSR